MVEARSRLSNAFPLSNFYELSITEVETFSDWLGLKSKNCCSPSVS